MMSGETMSAMKSMVPTRASSLSAIGDELSKDYVVGAKEEASNSSRILGSGMKASLVTIITLLSVGSLLGGTAL